MLWDEFDFLTFLTQKESRMKDSMWWQRREDYGVQDLQWFDINHMSGLITTRLNIDRETQAQLQLVG